MIRSVQADDFEAWLALWRGYQAFYKVDIPADISRQTWARLLDPAEPMHAALIIREGRAVGLVHYIFHRSTWTSGNYCYLQDLFVDAGQRGTGAGRALIEHVYAQATLAGAARVYWLTHESNATAMRLYDDVADRPGFVQYRKNIGV